MTDPDAAARAALDVCDYLGQVGIIEHTPEDEQYISIIVRKVFDAELTRLREENERLSKLKLFQEEACRALNAKHERLRETIVQVIGGTVEGQPTQTINYLQRLRELLSIEASVDSLTADNARLTSALVAMEAVHPASHQSTKFLHRLLNLRGENQPGVAALIQARAAMGGGESD